MATDMLDTEPITKTRTNHSAVPFAAALHYILLFAGMLVPVKMATTYTPILHSWFDRLMQWDSVWYLVIGQFGYHLPVAVQKQYLSATNTVPFHDGLRAAAFFPGLPFLIHLLGPIGALVLTNVLFILSVFVIYRLVHVVNPRLALFSAVAYAVNPASLYESTLYTEVYLIGLSAVIVWAISKNTRRFDILALLAVGLLGLFHQLGCLGAVFALRYIRVKRYVWAAVFTVTAGIGWMVDLTYFWLRYGHPLATFAAEKDWYRVWRFPGTSLVTAATHKAYFSLLFVLFCLTLAVLFMMYVFKSDRTWTPSGSLSVYSLEVAIWVGINAVLYLSTYTPYRPLLSVIRLFTVLWPIYTVPWLASLSHKRSMITQAVILSFSTVASLFGSILFTHGYFYQ